MENEEKLISFLKALPNSEEEQHLFSQLINPQFQNFQNHNALLMDLDLVQI